MIEKNKKNFIVNITGGAGKNLMFSGVAKNIKKYKPDCNLIVISPYPELLVNNENIYRVYKTGNTPYFYEDFIKDQDVICSAHDPYFDNDYILQKKHLIEIWSKLFIPEVSDFQMPEIKITNREFDFFMSKFNQIFENFQKPIFVINPFGGPNNQNFKYNWCRDIPPNQAQLIVDTMNDSGYCVIQIARPDQIQLKNCKVFTGSFREICCLLKIANKRLLIDSFCQHASSAMGLQSFVCWVTNTPTVFGYEINENILAKNYTNNIHYIDSFLQKENWTGEYMHYYPYDNSDVFDLDILFKKII